MLHYIPRHVSSIDVLIFRRKENCMPTVSGIVTLCKLPYRALIESGLSPLSISARHCMAAYRVWRYQILYTYNFFSSWRWAQRCSKHVEEYSVTCDSGIKKLCIKLVIDTRILKVTIMPLWEVRRCTVVSVYSNGQRCIPKGCLSVTRTDRVNEQTLARCTVADFCICCVTSLKF